MFKLGLDFKRIHNSIYVQHHSNVIEIEEKSNDGEAILEFIFHSSNPNIAYYEIKAEHKKFLEKLVGNNKCCDGILLRIENEKADIFLIELKSTMGAKTWEKVQKQFRGAALVAMAFCAILGAEVNSLSLYTAYLDDSEVNDEIETEKMQSKIKGAYAKKPRVGRQVNSVKKWEESKIALFYNTEKITHHKIQLTKDTSVTPSINRGSYTVNI